MSRATITPHARLLPELLAVVGLGPVSASTVAAVLGEDETAIDRLLDEQVRRGRMKASRGQVRYELTDRGCVDLAKERLIYAILAEFIVGDAVSIAGMSESVAGDLGLARRALGTAATSAMNDGWIAPKGTGGAYLSVTAAGRRAWACAEAECPRFLAPVATRRRRPER